MTLEELKDKIRLINLAKDSEIVCARKTFVDANNPYKIGDRVTEHAHTICIEKIGYYLAEEPCAIYMGVLLNKDGTPRKDRKKDTVYQCNIQK